MDQRSVYSVGVLPSVEEDGTGFKQMLEELTNFILDFHLNGDFIYRDQIRQNVLMNEYYCDVDIAHLISYNEEIAHRLTTEPAVVVPIVSIQHR